MSDDVETALGIRDKEEAQEKVSTQEIFYDADETEVACLGRSYLASFLTEGTVSKSVLIASNKRLYQKGRMFEKTLTGKLTKWDAQSVVPLDSITGTAYRTRRAIGTLIFGIIAIVVSLLLYSNRGIQYLAAPAFALGLILIIAYALSSKELFVVNFAGGQMAMDSHWYSNEEMNEFQKKLHHARDKRIGGKVG